MAFMIVATLGIVLYVSIVEKVITILIKRMVKKNVRNG